MAKLSCRDCGYDLVELSAAIDAVRAEYKFTTEELTNGPASIRVWCDGCAVADGRVDSASEVKAEFHWEVRH